MPTAAEPAAIPDAAPQRPPFAGCLRSANRPMAVPAAADMRNNMRLCDIFMGSFFVEDIIQYHALKCAAKEVRMRNRERMTSSCFRPFRGPGSDSDRLAEVKLVMGRTSALAAKESGVPDKSFYQFKVLMLRNPAHVIFIDAVISAPAVFALSLVHVCPPRFQ